jgi:hypothetical protein
VEVLDKIDHRMKVAAGAVVNIVRNVSSNLKVNKYRMMATRSSKVPMLV